MVNGGGLGEALGFPLDGGPAHRLCARPQVPFIVPLTEASAQFTGNALFRAIKRCSRVSAGWKWLRRGKKRPPKSPRLKSTTSHEENQYDDSSEPSDE